MKQKHKRERDLGRAALQKSDYKPHPIMIGTPVPFEADSKITLQCTKTNYCILLTPEEATDLGLRLIQCVARKQQQRIDRKLHEERYESQSRKQRRPAA